MTMTQDQATSLLALFGDITAATAIVGCAAGAVRDLEAVGVEVQTAGMVVRHAEQALWEARRLLQNRRAEAAGLLEVERATTENL